jgi:hypothetical protein
VAQVGEGTGEGGIAMPCDSESVECQQKTTAHARYPTDLVEGSWTQFVAGLLAADTAGGEPLRHLLSMVASQDIASLGMHWRVYTDRETNIGVGQPDILIESRGLRIIIENKVGAPLGHNQLQRYADHFDAEEGSDSIPNVYLYLSPEGRESDDDRWTTISYMREIDAILRSSLGQIEAEWGGIGSEFWETFERLKQRRVRGGTRLEFPKGYNYESRRGEWLDGVDCGLKETVDWFINMLLRNYRVTKEATKDCVIRSQIAIVGVHLTDGTKREVRLLREPRTYLARALGKVQRVEPVEMPPALGVYFHTSLDIVGTPFERYAYAYPTATGFIITRSSLRLLDEFLEFCGVPPLCG